MNYYEKNLESIKKYKKYLYSSMEKANVLSELNQLDEIHSVDTKNKEQAVIIKFHSADYRLNSLYYPTQEAKKWVEQYNFKNLNNVISMFGFGNGIFARAIIEKMGENDTLLIYEPCAEIFYHVLNYYDITDILNNKRVSISIKDINEFEFHNSLQAVMNITNISSQIMCVYPQYDKIFIESCITFWKEIQDTYNHTKLNINTEIIFGKRFIDNILNNIRFIHNSNTLLELKENLPKDIPAIVVAAGPSVEKNINELKRAKGKAIIFAVDRILDYLLDSGVEPDFIVTIDPIKPLEYFTRREDLDIPLICFLESNHEILNCHAGRKIICNCGGFLESVYKDANKIPPRMNSSASVATVAFTACIHLGYEKIILVGQDLAYDGEYSHAGVVEDRFDSIRDVMVEDINGELIRSRYDWKEFLIWYQDMIIMHPKLQVIDAKEKGAKIRGSIVMPLKEVMDKYCNKEFNSNLILDHTEVTFSKDELQILKVYLQDNIETLVIIKNKANEAIKGFKKLIQENKKNIVLSYKEKNIIKKLSTINNYIAEQPIYLIMDNFIKATSAHHLAQMYHFTDDIKDDSIKTYEKSICIFEAIIEAVDYIKPRLEDAIEHVI